MPPLPHGRCESHIIGPQSRGSGPSTSYCSINLLQLAASALQGCIAPRLTAPSTGLTYTTPSRGASNFHACAITILVCPAVTPLPESERGRPLFARADVFCP